MTNVLIVYATELGNTGKMAEKVAEGASSVPGTQVVLKKADDTTVDDVKTCDALIVGSPVRHRTAHHSVKLFIENVCEMLWLTDQMVGKVGGCFTIGGGYGDCGAGCELTQIGILSALAASGLILVPLPKTTPGFTVSGMHWGPHGRSGGPDMEPIGVKDEMLVSAFHHGANIARVATALKGRDLLAKGNVSPPSDILKQFQSAGKVRIIRNSEFVIEPYKRIRKEYLFNEPPRQGSALDGFPGLKQLQMPWTPRIR